MTEQEIDRLGRAGHDATSLDLALLSIEQLAELEAKIAAEREERQQRFITEASALGLRLAPRRHKPRHRRPSTRADTPSSQSQHEQERDPS